MPIRLFFKVEIVFECSFEKIVCINTPIYILLTRIAKNVLRRGLKKKLLYKVLVCKSIWWQKIVEIYYLYNLLPPSEIMKKKLHLYLHENSKTLDIFDHLEWLYLKHTKIYTSTHLIVKFLLLSEIFCYFVD